MLISCMFKFIFTYTALPIPKRASYFLNIFHVIFFFLRLSEIKKVQILAREFETPLGPVVAGSFIPNEPAKTMESYPNLLSK